jgi:hypothetical protein
LEHLAEEALGGVQIAPGGQEEVNGRAVMENLTQSASFHSDEKTSPSNPGIKHPNS